PINRPQTAHRTARNAGIGRPSPQSKPKALAGALAAREGSVTFAWVERRKVLQSGPVIVCRENELSLGYQLAIGALLL
ncbi:hypothetical protein A7K93_10255, partial [Candidatus Methylacidiphilum fumarolicum]